MSEFHIACASDKNYTLGITISVVSALHFLAKDRVPVVHVLDMGIPDKAFEIFCQTQKRCRADAQILRHKISNDLFKDYPKWFGSIAVYARVMLPALLPGVKWCVYADGDTLYLNDPSLLERFSDETKLLYAQKLSLGFSDNLKEFRWFESEGLEIDREHYFLSGFLWMNLAKMREFGMIEKVMDFLGKHPSNPVSDQVALNYVCQGAVGILPSAWNFITLEYSLYPQMSPCVAHFCADFPWRRPLRRQLVTDLVHLWYRIGERYYPQNLMLKTITMKPHEYRYKRLVFLIMSRLPHWFYRLNGRTRAWYPLFTGRVPKADWKRIENSFKESRK